jgi:hypothetical protein
MNYRVLIVCLGLLNLALPIQAQETVQEWYKASIEAYEQQDWESYLKASRRADALRPNHPTLTYNLASAYALSGLKTKAAEVLNQRMSFYADTSFMSDPDFVELRNSFQFNRVEREIPRYLQPVSQGKTAFVIQHINVHAEGILWTDYLQRFLISDIYQGIILEVAENGQSMRPLVTLSDFGYWSAMGMAQDPNHENRIWVTTAAVSQFAGFESSIAGKSAVLCINLEDQTLVHELTAPGDHLFGDLTLGPDGTVYVSDSNNPKIYRWSPDSDHTQLQPLPSSDDWWNLQGLAISVDGNRLWVADYITGIHEINLLTESIRPFHYDNSSLRGTDGLYRIGNQLALIQNGTLPKRITRIHINNPEELPVFLEANLPNLEEPTLGTVRHGKLYYIANSAWGLYDEQGRPEFAKWPDIEVRVLNFN